MDSQIRPVLRQQDARQHDAMHSHVQARATQLTSHAVIRL
jgi:hypothetical protein